MRDVRPYKVGSRHTMRPDPARSPGSSTIIWIGTSPTAARVGRDGRSMFCFLSLGLDPGGTTRRYSTILTEVAFLWPE